MLSVKVIQPQDVEIRVASLADGLTQGILIRALQAGVIEFDGTSPLAPPTSAGSNFWSGVVSHLREELLPKGWTMCNEGCFAVVVSPCERVRIACGRGSDGTGDPDLNANPTTRSKKGPRTIAAIHANSNMGQGSFGFIQQPKPSSTWFLLYTRQDNWVSAELSLPGSFCEEKQRPDGWIERIPLPPVPVDPAHFEDLNSAPDFDVVVKRRS